MIGEQINSKLQAPNFKQAPITKIHFPERTHSGHSVIRIWNLFELWNFVIWKLSLNALFQNFLNPLDRLFDAGLVFHQCKPHEALSIFTETDSRGDSHFSFS